MRKQLWTVIPAAKNRMKYVASLMGAKTKLLMGIGWKVFDSYM
jgi:hypothetical protein